jgi:hypothetical protein
MGGMLDQASVVDWLLDADPAIRWQVMQCLGTEPKQVVNEERARIATEGWGAKLLALQGEDGQWAGGAHFPGDFSWDDLERDADGRLIGQPWTATSWSLTLLRTFGLDPDSPEAKRAVALVAENCRWEHAGQPFFEGEVEPCINGLTVANGSYFGVDVSSIVDRLLDEQMEDGGWNCEQESGSTRGSFHTTIAVLEGLLEFQEHSGESPAVSRARADGEEYLLERRLLRRLTTGEVIDESWKLLSFPTWWRYDVLRGLDYLRRTGTEPDSRISEALAIVAGHRGADGRWPRQNIHRGAMHFDVDLPEGQPSRWNTLRASRVLRWAGRDVT